MDGGNAPIADNVQRSRHLRWSVNFFYKFIHSSDDWERSYTALNRYSEERATGLSNAWLYQVSKLPTGNSGEPVFFVTHLYEFAHNFYEKRKENAIFLRAERHSDGGRTFKLIEGEPLQTSYGEDLSGWLLGVKRKPDKAEFRFQRFQVHTGARSGLDFRMTRETSSCLSGGKIMSSFSPPCPS